MAIPKKKYFIVKEKIHSGAKNNGNYSSKTQKLLTVSQIVTLLKNDEYANYLINVN